LALLKGEQKNLIIPISLRLCYCFKAPKLGCTPHFAFVF